MHETKNINQATDINIDIDIDIDIEKVKKKKTKVTLLTKKITKFT